MAKNEQEMKRIGRGTKGIRRVEGRDEERTQLSWEGSPRDASSIFTCLVSRL